MRFRPTLAVLAAAFAFEAAVANVPPVVTSFQGVLRDAQDRPLDGSYAMTFRYWSDPAAVDAASDIGSESHAVVTVTGGLFDVLLGSQPFVAGASGYGGANIAVMFGDFDQVWLEIAVAGETLSPRIRFAAALYAYNCSQVQDRGPGEFLLNFESNSFHVGTLGTDSGTTLDVNGAAQFNGSIQMDDDGPEGSQHLYFWDAGSATGQSIRWDDGAGVFGTSAGLLANGSIVAMGHLRSGWLGLDATTYNSLNALGVAPSPGSGDMGNSGDLYVMNDVEVDGSLYLNGSLRFDDDGPDASQFLYFYDDGSPTNEWISWSEAEDRFEVTNDVAIAGSFRAGSTGALPVGYNAIGTGATDNAVNVADANDLYVTSNLEVDGNAYLGSVVFMRDVGPDASQTFFFYEGGAPGGRYFRWADTAGRFEMNDSLKLTGAIELNNTIEMDDDGPDQNQRIYFWEDGILNGESLGWTDANDRFEVTDSFHVVGDLSATGAKPFVQNHPYRADLSVVYAALEGDEVGTYTRGSGRLVRGEARVALGETFALVTHPDVGITASVTPRGGAAQLFVASVSTTELVVRAAPGAPPDASFDYVVFGLRIGFEEHPTVEVRKGEAPVPSPASVEESFRDRPELRAHTALARFRRMAEEAGEPPRDLAASAALRRAVGEYDPGRPPAPIEAASAGGGPDEGEGAEARQGSAPVASTGTQPPYRLYEVSEAVVAGEVLVSDPEEPSRLRRSLEANDRGVIGVAAGEAGSAYPVGSLVPVAESGIVRCRVDASFGAVARGDLLVASPIAGTAMRSSDPVPGTILGKALEPLASGQGDIRVSALPR